MTQFIMYDDGQGEFGPLTDLRPAGRLRTGSLLTQHRQARRLDAQLAACWTTSELALVLGEQLDVLVNELPEGDTHLCVNGRWSALDALTPPAVGAALIDAASGDVVMATLDAPGARLLCETGHLPDGVERVDTEAVLYRYPWDILDHLGRALELDLSLSSIPVMTGDELKVHGAHPVLLHPGATVLPGVVADTSGGPVVINDGAVIRSNASLCGPCSIGLGSTVMDGAVIRPRTVVGPQCKIAGEVGASIIHGYSNKAHDGHLGDSIIGCWVNLGAGTTNSNLLNTYAEVLMRLTPDSQVSRTGRAFMGAIIGDHVKTAIGTRLMTGTVLGTGCMIASTAPPPGTLDAFTWLTDRGRAHFRIDKFLDVARAVMARRDLEPGPGEVGELTRLCEAAARRRSD
jgi:UDP-N-acetylglucosamine diphosphorylase/glucosamine-1-phosphate N-acetyltransferase